MFIDVAFFKTTPFSLSSTVTSPREDDDLLVYYVSLPVPAPAPIHVQPPITQVYSRSQNPPVSRPTPTASILDLVSSDDLLIALRKGKRQCAHPISLLVSYNHLSSSYCSFIVSLDSIFLPNTIREALFQPG